jgi:hypothetical protein
MTGDEAGGEPGWALTSDKGSSTAAPHPEEMKGTIGFRIGNSVFVRASGRATPAGLAMAALLVSAILLPMLWLATRRRSV